MANPLNQDLRNKVVVLKAEVMRPEFRDIRHRLLRVEAGFGMMPFTSGTAIVGKYLATNEEARLGSDLIERLATPEEVEAGSKTTPSQCRLPSCAFNTLPPGEDSQECVACRHLARPVTLKHMAYFVMETQQAPNGEYMALIAVEGEQGYHVTDWTWGRDLKVAEQIARERNARMDIDETEAFKIVASTMRK